MSRFSSPAATTTVGSAKRRDYPKHLIIWLILGIELLPFYMMVQISFKDNAMFNANPWFPANPLNWVWSNWVFGMQLIGPYIANTVFVAVTGTVITLFLAIMGAYFFARYKLPFSGVLWSAFLVLMLMPGVANIVPLFSLLKSMGLLNTLWALIIVGIAGGQVFNIFVLRNFIEDLPKDLFEAAEIDGASHFQQVINVVIPMSGPIIGTLAILAFLGKWNDFLLPLIVLRDKELFTLGVGLIYLDGEYVKQWGRIMASFFIASVPLIIIFLFTMKLFVRGLSAGAVKG
jgi:multiple sugar transport system permease protein